MKFNFDLFKDLEKRFGDSFYHAMAGSIVNFDSPYEIQLIEES